MTVLGEKRNGSGISAKGKSQTDMEDGERRTVHIHRWHAGAAIYKDNYKWDYPVVLMLTPVKPSFQPPLVKTETPKRAEGNNSYLLNGEVTDMGGSPSLQVGFEYRQITADDVSARSGPWVATTMLEIVKVGPCALELKNLPPGNYEVHAIVKHPLLTIYGADVPDSLTPEQAWLHRWAAR